MTDTVKDFQFATAERIFHIFKEMGHRRVLLADEVGLGKTFVARQVISLVREWHKDELKDDFFRVVYICSNANIADQNIGKLGVDNPMSISESRLSMQHLYIEKNNRENIAKKEKGEMPETIIPLTPSTSFRFFSSQGTVNERALIYVILRHLPALRNNYAELYEFLCCDIKKQNWQCNIDKYRKLVDENGDEYITDIIQKLDSKLNNEFVDKLIGYLQNGFENKERAELINSLRKTFAEISIEMLDPDLVIMDEFQRFNSLLEMSDDEQSMLTRCFFDDNRKNTKILLLSATPYKPYSTLEELNANQCDEQYQDFMKVMDFLFVEHDMNKRFHLTWQRYSASLKRTEVSDLTPLLEAKNEAENMLYGTMCRTERFNSGIIDDSNVTNVTVMPEDIVSYAQGQKLMDGLSERNCSLGNLPIEYVMSAPYLLSFMDKYKLKTDIVEALKRVETIKGYKTDTLLLSKYQINNYRPISQGNGKLKYLHDMVFGFRHQKKTHLLLWIPASNPYYKAGGLFETEEAHDFSKIILFSSWEMVPRMVSVMMSYYSELYTFGEIKKGSNDLRYIPQKKNRYGENRLKSDGILEYPCQTLAKLYNPQKYYGDKISVIKSDIKAQISKLLKEDERFASFPKQRRGNARYILSLMMLLDNQSIENYQDIHIPDNAVDVMTDIAIASPAVCAYRQSKNVDDARTTARAIVSIFNKPESAAIIDLLYNKQSDDDYYESVLDYCVKGNLQAVLDEYAHMLQTNHIGKAIEEAVITTVNYHIDTNDSIGSEEKKLSMRCHFAIPFIDKTVTDKSVLRTKNIRKAFNSPFRPFILSTTSIGQEGLDFHWYARKIVHWNLPSNPVDLEQREGRINRYKCLALRRNVASLYVNNGYKTWDNLFEIAKDALKGDHSDIVPYWCLPINEIDTTQRKHLQYIERIVPMFPLSRDGYKYERLIKVLALYRMTMGQPRQEELLDLLANMKLTDEQIKTLTIDLCPYNKKENNK